MTRAHLEAIETAKGIVHGILPENIIQSTTMPIRRAYSKALVKHFQDFVFIHINKCGGTSIERALGMAFVYHDTAQQRRQLLGERRWNDRFKMAAVRNPYDRLASIFLYDLRIAPPTLEQARATFPHFVTEVQRQHQGGRPDRLKYWTQRDWLSDEKSEIIIDHAYHLETLADCWPQVQMRISTAAPLAHRKKGPTGYSPREIYSPEAAKRALDIFSDDFDIFGYDPDIESNSAPVAPSPQVFSSPPEN